MEDDKFTTRFFASLFDRLTQWFAHATNGIQDFFARRGIIEEVCVKDAAGQTCLTRSQVDALLAASAAAGAPSSGVAPETPAASPTTEATAADAATTTAPNVAEPQPSSEEASEPASAPELEAANDNPPPPSSQHEALPQRTARELSDRLQSLVERDGPRRPRRSRQTISVVV